MVVCGLAIKRKSVLYDKIIFTNKMFKKFFIKDIK